MTIHRPASTADNDVCHNLGQ